MGYGAPEIPEDAKWCADMCSVLPLVPDLLPSSGFYDEHDKYFGLAPMKGFESSIGATDRVDSNGQLLQEDFGIIRR
jgi:hypothetical protein